MDENRQTLVNCLVKSFFDVAAYYSRLINNPAPIDIYGGLNSREVHVLAHLGKNPNINVTELAGIFSVTKGAMSKTISHLTSMNFIEKSVAEESGRELKLSLTDKGKNIFDRHEAKTMSNNTTLYERIDNLNISQLAAVAQFLEEMNKRLNDYSTTQEPLKNENLITPTLTPPTP
jgi:DNA-binding MarR family transcriptional regulator